MHALYIIIAVIGMVVGFPTTVLCESFSNPSVDMTSVGTTRVTVKGDRFNQVDPVTGQRFHIETIGKTTVPIGHYEFCRKQPQECGRNDYQEPMFLSKELWDKIKMVNREINARIKPMTDIEHHGKDEVWDYAPDNIGDCEDYVLVKRWRLMQLDIAPSNLLITVVRQSNGSGHAILTLRTQKFELVLDNLTDEIYIWYDTKYRFLKRQMPQHRGLWEGLNDPRNDIYTASTN